MSADPENPEQWVSRAMSAETGLLAAQERINAAMTLVDDLWRVSPCGCGHRADLHTMGNSEAVCTGGLALCDCRWSFVRIVQERLCRALTGAPS